MAKHSIAYAKDTDKTKNLWSIGENIFFDMPSPLNGTISIIPLIKEITRKEFNERIKTILDVILINKDECVREMKEHNKAILKGN